MTLSSFDPTEQGWERVDHGGFESFLGPFWQKRTPDGRLLVGLMTRADHVNRNGVVHGGVTLSMADQALGLVAYDATGGQKQATIQLDTHFLAPVRIGSFLECRAEVTRRARGVLFVSGTLEVAGRPVATAQGLWKVAEG